MGTWSTNFHFHELAVAPSSQGVAQVGRLVARSLLPVRRVSSRASRFFYTMVIDDLPSQRNLPSQSSQGTQQTPRSPRTPRREVNEDQCKEKLKTLFGDKFHPRYQKALGDNTIDTLSFANRMYDDIYGSESREPLLFSARSSLDRRPHLPSLSANDYRPMLPSEAAVKGSDTARLLVVGKGKGASGGGWGKQRARFAKIRAVAAVSSWYDPVL